MLLAIDTATSMSGLALHDGDEVIAEYIWRTHRHHTVELAPEVALLLRRSGLENGNLSALAVASGPGSYTGLRIGMAFAKGLALVHGLPLRGIPTLDILAAGQPTFKGKLLGVVAAGRGRMAAIEYKWDDGRWEPETEPETLTLEELIESIEIRTLVCGELTGEQRKKLKRRKKITLAPASACLRRPSILAELAMAGKKKARETDPASLVPQYLGSLEAS